MRTFRIRSTVAAIAAAIPLSIGIDAHADEQESKSQSSAATIERPDGEQRARPQQAQSRQGEELVGKELYGARGEQVGEIDNVLMKDGKADAVLVDVGGFLGIGAKTVAIPIDQLQVGKDRVTAASLTEESAKSMPEFDRNRRDYMARVGDNGAGAANGATAQSAMGQQDKEFVEKAAQGNIAEIQVGHLAQQKGQSPAVRQMGGELVRDHTQARQKLETVVSATGTQLPSEPSASQKEELQRLQKLSGASFDAEFVKYAEKAHQRTIDLYEKQARNGQNQQLRNFAQSTLPTLKEHLKHAQSARKTAGRDADKVASAQGQ